MLPGHRNLSTMRAMQEPSGSAANAATRSGSTAEVFAAFLRLGLTSFGGPIAHLGYFHEEFVVCRKWLDERVYVDLVALSQFLPGPASSKVGIAIGLSRAGYLGALAAWAGFTLPSAIALVLFGYGVANAGGALGSGWLHGLKVAAVAVVANAVLSMMRSLAPDRERATLPSSPPLSCSPFHQRGDRSAPSCSAASSEWCCGAAKRRPITSRCRARGIGTLPSR